MVFKFFAGAMVWNVCGIIHRNFRRKVYKLSLSLAETCPNRNGTCGYGGCIFYGESGAGDFAARRSADVQEQIAQAKKRIEQKTNAKKFIAYFQSFTNTYLPCDVMRRAFTQAAQSMKSARYPSPPGRIAWRRM